MKFSRHNPVLKPSVRREAELSVFKVNDYKYPTNTLSNPMTEYIDIKENTLCGNHGAHKKKKRLGRGRSSGCGKSSGHGNKGQGHRRNKKKWGFEGGQTPISRRLPKYPIRKKNLKKLDYVNISRLVYCLRRGWIVSNPGRYITIKDMIDNGVIAKAKWGVKLLSKGAEVLQEYGRPIFIEVTDVSKPALDFIRSSGGMVRIKYLTPLKLKEHIKPEVFELPLVDPLPSPKNVVKLEKYRDMGCEVDYKSPNWLKEEQAKLNGYFAKKEKVSFQELVDKTKVRVKKTLARRYDFSF